MAAREHGDGAGEKAGAVRGGIDAARKPGDDDEARIAEITRELVGEFHSRGGGVAGADDGDEWP
jgi:hypothetical protein